MATDFEFIEINDNTATGRKVGGDFETQGADTIFHQTARNLNTRLEEVTGVTLASDTPTDIPLNGMESHVILDIAGTMDQAVIIQLQYTTGGPFYAANWEKMVPIRALGGIRDQNLDYDIGYSGFQNPGYDDGNPLSGGHVFMIPTNGAITCRIQLYGSTVTIAGTAWARVVLSSPPYQHTITKTVRKMQWDTTSYTTAAQPYAAGDVMGPDRDIQVSDDYGSEFARYGTLRAVRIGSDTFAIPDFDLVIGDTNFNVTDGDAGVGTQIGNVTDILEFRATPGVGQFPLLTLGGTANVGVARNLNLVLPMSYDSDFGDLARTCLIARGALTTNGSISARFLIDWG